MATLSTLVNFNGTNGALPISGLIADAAGNLFGTTQTGGAYGIGTVFEISNTTNGYGIPTVLVSFNGTNGANLIGGLIADAAGDLFGTTAQGGAHSSPNDQGGFGTVFEIARTSAGYASVPTTLINFDGNNGAGPAAGLTTDPSGNLFGTTARGGTNGDGTVFEIPKVATGYGTLITLVNLNGANGQNPYTSLTADAVGNLFGVAYNGGTNSDGTVFEIPKTAYGYGTLRTLVNFNGTDGVNPYGSLITDAAGDLFGTTSGGGTGGGSGTVFEIAKTTSGYGILTTLVAFNGADGAAPVSGLIADAAGDLFGTTSGGGANFNGTVFEIAKTVNGYGTLTTLVNFNATDGADPESGLIADAAGNLFGTTHTGGATGAGTVFEIAGTGFQVAKPPPIKLGDGNHTVKLSGSYNVVTISNGNSNVSGGQDHNTIVIGNGNSKVSLPGSDNSVTLGNGNGSVSVGGGNDTVNLGNGNGTITLGGSGSTVKLGNGTDTVHGGSGDTIHIAATTLNLYGTDEMVFIGTQNATVNDFSTGLNLKIGPTAGRDVLSNFASDSRGVVDLIGGIGGYTTPAAVLSALKTDGHGGTLLSFGGSRSLDFTGLAPSQLRASNFQIGG